MAAWMWDIDEGLGVVQDREAVERCAQAEHLAACADQPDERRSRSGGEVPRHVNGDLLDPRAEGHETEHVRIAATRPRPGP